MRVIYLILISIILCTQASCSARSVAERTVVYQVVSSATVIEQDKFTVVRSYTGVVETAQAANIAFE